MGQAESKKLMPFIRANSRKTVERFANMVKNVEIIPAVYGKSTPESIAWNRELNEWKNKILSLNKNQQFIGNESIIQLKQIYERLKESYTTKTK